MKIITCFKLVPEEQDIVVTPQRSLNFDRADAKISQFDLNAIEAAAQLSTEGDVRLAQRVPVRIRLDQQQGNLWPAGTTATVVITGKEDRDTSQANFFQKLAMRLREFG